jgi:transcriptional regulator with XRE-family HTH domain
MGCMLVNLTAGTTPMDHRNKTYVRPLRRRWGITQKEFAFLIGAKGGAAISRIEWGKRTPSFAATFACAIVLGTAPLELFPGLVSQIHDEVLRRATELYEALQGNPSKATRLKLDFLETVLARLESKGTANDV